MPQLLIFDKKFKTLLNPFYHEELIEAGCDEAGRGCYAGPVFAAAVILPKDFFHPTLNDSKLLTPPVRHELKYFIKANAIAENNDDNKNAILILSNCFL